MEVFIEVLGFAFTSKKISRFKEYQQFKKGYVMTVSQRFVNSYYQYRQVGMALSNLGHWSQCGRTRMFQQIHKATGAHSQGL